MKSATDKSYGRNRAANTFLVLAAGLASGGFALARSVPSPAPEMQVAFVPTEPFNACSIFSAADAQQVLGVPMEPKPGNRSQNVCMYQEAKQRPNSLMQGTLSLTVNKRKSAGDEDKGWASLKEVRHLKAGQKNVQVLTGIGQEAYFTGNAEKGEVGVAAVIVRQGSFDFALDSMVMEYVASPEAMKNAAKAIAGKLQ